MHKFSQEIIKEYNELVDALIVLSMDFSKMSDHKIPEWIDKIEEEYLPCLSQTVLVHLEKNKALSGDVYTEIALLRERIFELPPERWDVFSLKYAEDWQKIRKQANLILNAMKVKVRTLDHPPLIPE